MKIFAVIILGSCLAGLSLQSVASETATNSIDSLVAEAYRNNPEVKWYEAEITAARAGLKLAAVRPQPELNVEIGHKSSRDNTGVRGDGLAWSVSVMQSFEWPGRVGLRKAIANYDIQLAELGLQQFRTELANRVRLAAWNLWAARQQLETARTVQKRFSDLREVLVQRDPAGIAPALEIRVLEATELGLRKRVTDAEVEMQDYRSELNLLCGKAPAAEIQIEKAELDLAPGLDIRALLAIARTNNFELRVKEAELTQQGFKVDLARSDRFPSISFGPMISEERSLGRDRIVGVGISLPLPLWRRNAANVESAEARRIQAEAMLQVTLREIELKLTQASQAYETKLAEIQKWHPDSLKEFEQAAALADRHYQLGAVPVTTYVELQKQYIDAVSSLLSLRTEALKAAGTLEQAAGAGLGLVTLNPQKQSKLN